MFDVILRGDERDVGVTDGAIAALGPELEGGAREEIDARGLLVLPGGLDPHVHFNEPGRTHWEGLATGSAALAAGGFTAFFDMPLNSSPPVLDSAAFDAKQAAARVSSCLDFGLWGGLVPGNVGRLEELSRRGVVGVKAFMAPSGLDDFPAADDLTLLEGMAVCAQLDLPVAVHAENARVTTALAERAIAAGATGPRDYLASRPVIAELEAIGRAIAFAAETGCALHVVHVSTGRGVALVAEARAAGVDVTCETCPHYLALGEADLERLGTLAKCAPPLRDDDERNGLWRRLASEEIDMVCSDHSPSSPDLKDTDDFFAAWGGITGCQTTLPLLLTEGHVRRELALEAVARLTARNPAARFRLARKGRIEPGADADLALVRIGTETTLRPSDLRYRHAVSAWTGWTMRARVERTLLRGRTVFDGDRVAAGGGRLLKPAASPDPVPIP